MYLEHDVYHALNQLLSTMLHVHPSHGRPLLPSAAQRGGPQGRKGASRKRGREEEGGGGVDLSEEGDLHLDEQLQLALAIPEEVRCIDAALILRLLGCLTHPACT